jgi:hypothetical protein
VEFRRHTPMKRIAAALALAFYTGPALASDFLTYEGRDAIHEGRGGERKSVDGIDFWMSGDPPRRYQVLGSIEDRRHQSGLIGLARMSALDHDMAKIAKANGGDAVILEGQDTDVIGAGASYGRGWAVAAPIRKHDSRWTVIRYLPDEAPPSAEASPAPPTASPAAPAGRVPGRGVAGW